MGFNITLSKSIPYALAEHILPFNWDVRKVWALDTLPMVIPREDIDYLLYLPLWSSIPNNGMMFDTTPMEVIDDPFSYKHQHERIAKADLSHPLEMLLMDYRPWILDGVHRLARLYIEEIEMVAVRFHSESTISKIKI